MNNYPIIILSTKYQEAESLVPKLPEKPKEPELKLIKKNWFEKLILWCDDADDMEINNQRKERYEKQMETYKKDLISYQKKVEDILSYTNINNFRIIERERRIATKYRGKELDRDVQKGRYDDFFLQKLKNSFNNKISDLIEFTLPNGNAFVPDAAFIDPISGLCIDIEIDEPYSIPSGKAIHYIGGPDDNRNTYFAEMGWFVIRFAEEQIAKYSEQCIVFIKEFIAQLKNGQRPSFPFPVKRWTINDSFLLFKNNYRQTY